MICSEVKLVQIIAVFFCEMEDDYAEDKRTRNYIWNYDGKLNGIRNGCV